MEKEKNNMKGFKVVIGLLVIITLALATLLVLVVTGKVNFKEKNESEERIVTNNNQTIDTEKESDEDKNETTNECNCNCDYTSYASESFGNGTANIDYEKLAKIGKSTYNYAKGAYINSDSLNILSDGKILVNFSDNISNISNAEDLILFAGPGADTIAYILTSDGNVYKYNLTNISSKNFNATKLDEYSNIKQIIRYKTRKANAGGCDYVVLIDGDGKYYSIDHYCV